LSNCLSLNLLSSQLNSLNSYGLDIKIQLNVPGEKVDLQPVVKKHPALDVTLTVSDANDRLLSRYQRTVRVVPEELLKADKPAALNNPAGEKK